MTSRVPGQRSPQVIMHDIVVPVLSRAMNKGPTNQKIAKLDYTTEPVGRSTYVTITTDAGDTVRLIIDPATLES